MVDEPVKWAYAFDYLRSYVIYAQGEEAIPETRVPEPFQGCAGYGWAPDCWDDWVITFIDAAKDGRTIDLPEKGSPDDESSF